MTDPVAYAFAIDGLVDLLDGLEFDKFAAIESRGFIFGGPLALDLDKGMVLVRKAGKLPAKVHAIDYELEYGSATLEIHQDAITAADEIMIVDDLLATGGTALATAQLIRNCGGKVAGFLFLVELDFLGGREKLTAEAPVFSLVNYS